VLVEVGSEAAEELGHHLSKEYPLCFADISFEDVISMWREAISIEWSEPLKLDSLG